MLLRGTSEKYEYLGKNEKKKKTLFLPIGQWPRPVRKMKKTGQKSRWTVPLNQYFVLVLLFILCPGTVDLLL